MPLRGQIFSTRDEVINATNQSLSQLKAEFWEAGFDALIERYKKCISIEGEYVERASCQPRDTADGISDSDSD